mgnify:CR=1 FL=1
MKRGDRNPRVETMQRILVRLGFLTESAFASGPGIFGPKTEAAVKAFQASVGLRVDGVVGKDTESALVHAMKPKAGTRSGTKLTDDDAGVAPRASRPAWVLLLALVLVALALKGK